MNIKPCKSCGKRFQRGPAVYYLCGADGPYCAACDSKAWRQVHESMSKRIQEIFSLVMRDTIMRVR